MVKRINLVRRSSCNERGSFTVEAALIFPLIILALVYLILALMLMYHKVLLTKTAADLATQAVVSQLGNDRIYSSILQQNTLSEEDSFSVVIGRDESLERKCSALIEELGTKSLGYYERRFKEIQVAAYRELCRKIMKPEETAISVNFHKGPMNKGMTITITQKMKIPFGSITLTGIAKASETEPAEYIRNIDLTLEYAERLKKGISKRLPDFHGSTTTDTNPGGH